MPLVPMPDGSVIEVNIFSTLCGQRVMNTFHYAATTAFNPALDYRAYLDALKEKLATVDTGLIATLNALYPTNAFMEKMHLQPIWPNRLRYQNYTLAVDGTGGSPADTANVAMSFKRVSTGVGRFGVGRVQVPLCTLWRDEGYVDLVAIDTLTTAFKSAMLGTITTSLPTYTWEPVLFGLSVDPPPGYLNVTPLIDATVEDKVRVMRRRTVRLGE